MIKGHSDHPACNWADHHWQTGCKNDKWLPEKDDSFTLTTQVKTRGLAVAPFASAVFRSGHQ